MTIQTVQRTLNKAAASHEDSYLALLAIRTAPGNFELSTLVENFTIDVRNVYNVCR